MAHFYLYIANIVFVTTLLGLFTFLAARMAYRDGEGMLKQSCHSIFGALARKLINLPSSAATSDVTQLIVQETIEETGLEAGHVFPLQIPLTLIGRGANNQIVLLDPMVSSAHAVLTYERGAWWLEDRNSRNGTVLYPHNGISKLVQDRPEKLQGGDVIEIGNTRLRLAKSTS